MMRHDANTAWQWWLQEILEHGESVAPRGLSTLEVPQHTVVLDMRYPIVTIPDRKLSYTFMAAEALWIVTGDNRTETIVPYNSRMAAYSDDGKTFFGAYGPRFMKQLAYVVNTLHHDNSTRQAVLTLWRQNPQPSKDIPCTVALSFMLRQGRLNLHVFMRSSDAWFGVPYDWYNFTILTLRVATLLNDRRHRDHLPPVGLGTMHFTAASGHLYEPQYTPARQCVAAVSTRCAPVPDEAVQNWPYVLGALLACRDRVENEWWPIRPRKEVVHAS